jgi:hypothetical protein
LALGAAGIASLVFGLIRRESAEVLTTDMDADSSTVLDFTWKLNRTLETANEIQAFGLTEVGVVTLEGGRYVLYRDGTSEDLASPPFAVPQDCCGSYSTVFGETMLFAAEIAREGSGLGRVDDPTLPPSPVWTLDLTAGGEWTRIEPPSPQAAYLHLASYGDALFAVVRQPDSEYLLLERFEDERWSTLGSLALVRGSGDRFRVQPSAEAVTVVGSGKAWLLDRRSSRLHEFDVDMQALDGVAYAAAAYGLADQSVVAVDRQARAMLLSNSTSVLLPQGRVDPMECEPRLLTRDDILIFACGWIISELDIGDGIWSDKQPPLRDFIWNVQDRTVSALGRSDDDGGFEVWSLEAS